MDVYDREAMSRTLRVTFRGEKRVATRKYVLDGLKGVMDLRQLKAVYKCGEGPAWYLIFMLEVSTEMLGGHIEDERDGIDRRNISLRVYWFPLHMNIELVKQYMSDFGTNVYVFYEEEEYEGHAVLRLQTGVIRGEMTVTEKKYHGIP